jgi:MarR family transcriptional regulator for hemolysin
MSERQLENSLGHWAARLSWASRGALERRLRALELSPPMGAALCLLRDGAERATDLADKMGVDNAAVTRLLDRLAEAGWVERCAVKDDKRARRIELSAKARGKLDAVEAVFRDVEAAIEKGLGAAEKKALLKALRELTERAEKVD